MLEFSSETKQEQPDAGRMSLSEARDASRDSGESSNKGGSGESGGSLNDLKMPSGENFREQGQIENRPEPMMDAKEGKSDAVGGEQAPETKAAGNDDIREQGQIENRPESETDLAEGKSDAATGENIREQGQLENRPGAIADTDQDKSAAKDGELSRSGKESDQLSDDKGGGSSLDDLKMPTGDENFREQEQIENRPGAIMDADQEKSAAKDGDLQPTGKEGDQFSDDKGGGGSLDDLKMPHGDEDFREQGQIEHKAESLSGSAEDTEKPGSETQGYSDWRDSQFGEGSENKSEATAEADPDRDGHANQDEMKDGTDPQRAEERGGEQTTDFSKISQNPSDDALREE